MNENLYSTEKLTLAAYLIASEKSKLVDAQALSHSKQVLFVLSKHPTTLEISSFFSGEAKVSALRYAETLTNLKGILYEVRNNKIGGLSG